MNHEKDFEPAFPIHAGGAMSDGMSLRDYFAGQALSGLLAYSGEQSGACYPFPRAAADAYRFADAMLAERSKSNVE